MSVVVMGVGFSGAFPSSRGLSYREMIQRAAVMAYEDAGVTPDEIDGAVSVEEDFLSGYSIADEYTPDQLGMVKKPVYTIPGDFLQGIGSAVMQLRTGRFRTVVVQSYCKASNVLNHDEVVHFALDPVYNRLGVSPKYLAGIEMQRFMAETDIDDVAIAEIAAYNRSKALLNPLAPYGQKTTAESILSSRMIASPMTEGMIARPADAAVVIVLGIGEEMVERTADPVYITGTGWGSGNSIIERRDHGISEGTALAARMALGEAGIVSARDEVDVFYINDIMAHRQLMHMAAMGLDLDSLPRINPDGGAMGGGDLFEATSGARFYDAVRMLRGQAGTHAIEDAEVALVHGWRGLPTDTCAVVILEGDGRSLS